jgi:hypothetical protein
VPPFGARLCQPAGRSGTTMTATAVLSWEQCVLLDPHFARTLGSLLYFRVVAAPALHGTVVHMHRADYAHGDFAMVPS